MDVPLYPSPTAHGGPPPHIPEGLRPKAERPEQDADVPRTPGQYDLLTQAHTGLAGALSRFGLASGLVDFGRALAIALDDPALLEGYFKGGHGMAPADLRKPISKTPRIAGMQPSYPVYKPGDEPTGTIVPSDLLEHFRKFTDGDTLGAVACLTGRHPVNLMRKIVVPMLYRSEDEVLEWRERVTAAINDLSESDFDSREAFDALLALGTFDIAYQQFNDRDLMSKLGDTLVNRITSKALPDLVRPIERKPGSGKFKVGYISENLSSSNGGSWALGWLKNRGEDIETYCFCLNGAPDWISMRFRDEAEHFYVFREDVPQHARFIKSLDLDVLIYTDIGMSGRNWQYASMRLAPVQCTAWGHPVTSGLPTIDCYLSSELMEPPNGQDHYREKLVLLPGSGLCYPRNVVPASRMYKGDFGLDEGPLYLSCQNPMKYLPRWDYLYREICESTARPIVFVEGPMPMEKGILKKRMKDAGINAIWLPGLSPSDFLALIRLADVCLDTPGWNGGNTTIHSLTEGKPVITLPGEFMRGRHTLAFAAMAGVPGIVAGNPEDYVSLACDPCRLSDAMRELNADALYEDPRPVCALDDFIRSAR